MKKKLLIIIPIILILICGGIYLYNYYFYDPYEIPDDVTIELNDNNYPVYEKHYSKDLVKSINADILYNDILLEYQKIGTYTYTLNFKYKKKTYKYDIEYNVKDVTKPIFISAPGSLTIAYDDDKEVCNKIVYADDYDNIPTCKISGEYDKTKIGTYSNLEYIITDSSGNENTKAFSLNVVSKINTNTNYATPKYLYINDIINKYKNDNTSIGIDVSKWQGNVDFNKVKEAGVEFVIMRIGSQRSPEEEISMDVKFKEYYQAVKDAGLKVGVYVYNVSTSPADGVKTAKWVMKELNGDKLDFPIAYDWESWTNFMDYKISLHTLAESYLAFEKELKNNGYDAMLYSSKYYLENVWSNFEDSKIWLAHYTSQTDYQGDYMMWQMTSSCKISGITENTVDVDILYK